MQIGDVQSQIAGFDERTQSQFTNVNTAIESVRYDSDKNIKMIHTDIRALKEETASLTTQIGLGTSFPGQLPSAITEIPSSQGEAVFPGSWQDGESSDE